MSNDEETVQGLQTRASKLLSLLNSLPESKISPSALLRLSKLISSELRFLHSDPHPPVNNSNLGYLEAVVQVLRQPDIDGVSAVLHKFNGIYSGKRIEAHVDVVCTLHAMPVWIVVSGRNPSYIYWSEESDNVRSWKFRVQQLTIVAQNLNVLRPLALLFCFARGVPPSVLVGFEEDIGASNCQFFQQQNFTVGVDFNDSCFTTGSKLIEKDDGDWVYIDVSTVPAIFDGWIAFQVDINNQTETFLPLKPEVFQQAKECLSPLHFEENSEVMDDRTCDAVVLIKEHHEIVHWHNDFDSYAQACNELFLSCLSRICRSSDPLTQIQFTPSNPCFHMKRHIVNLDTTALIALVSELSNGAASSIISMNNEDLLFKFKTTAQFMRDQATEEINRPLMKDMVTIFENRSPFMSKTVCREFKSLVMLCGSFKEKVRAEELMQAIPVVPDTPSIRIRSLCETGKIKEKNKVIFGTGDAWHAPTLTANLSFVRAVRQTGMALSILEHQPRALVGEKCG